MRVLQNVGIYESYARRLAERLVACTCYADALGVFLGDGFEGCHVLKGAYARDEQFLLTVGNSSAMQAIWARGRTLSKGATREDVLLAQMEEHRAEVFYNLDPVRFDDRMLKRLPSCVRRTICWNAAPSPHQRFAGYDLVVNNFPGILKRYETFGCRTAYFFPSLAPLEMPDARAGERPIDIAFVGGFSRHHVRRNRILDDVAALASACHVEYHLELGRANRIAEGIPFGLFGLLARYRLTRRLRAVVSPPLYGRAMLDLFSRSKIVLNAAIDMSGGDKGNIRCFEAMSSGAMLLSDAGSYPDGMVTGSTFYAYEHGADAVKCARSVLSNDELRLRLAEAGQCMVRDRYSKGRQWLAFEALVAGKSGSINGCA